MMEGKREPAALFATSLATNDLSEPAGLRALSDAAIVPFALEGRRDAWNALILRHDRRLLLSLLARGVRVDRAREIAQETWARLIAQQRAGRLEHLELPGLAIAQAGFFAMEDKRRRALGLTSMEDGSSELGAIVDPAAGVEERLLSREQLSCATAELNRCSPAARAVFELVYSEPGVPHADAARQLGLSVQRLRQTLCEVRTRIRKALEAIDD